MTTSKSPVTRLYRTLDRSPKTRERRRGLYNRTTHRLREIEKIIKDRHGLVPDTDDADIYLDQVACCQHHALWKRGQKPAFDVLLDRLNLWCEHWAANTSTVLRARIVKSVMQRPRLDDADICAARLRLSYDERTRLAITTIGSFDVDKRERTKRRKAKKRVSDRERARRNRAVKGACSRAEYLSKSLSATEPWTAQGISRRTWERRRRQSQLCPVKSERPDASPSPSSTVYMLGDEPAASVAKPKEDQTSSWSSLLRKTYRVPRGGFQVAASDRPMLARFIMLATQPKRVSFSRRNIYVLVRYTPLGGEPEPRCPGQPDFRSTPNNKTIIAFQVC